MSKSTSIISLLFIAGCIHWPGDTHLPKPNPAWGVGTTNAAKSLPPMPAKKVSRAKPYVTPVMEFLLPEFQYPVDPCAVAWTLQGSSNLVTWTDLQTYSTNCPVDHQVFTNAAMCYFYRLKAVP